MRNLFLSLIFFLSASALFAQQLTVTLNLLSADKAPEVALYIAPLTDQINESVPFKFQEENAHQACIPVSSTGFYNVICVHQSAQYIYPLYFKGNEHVALDVDLAQTVPMLKKLSVDNQALYAYTRFVFAHDKALWTQPFATVNDVQPFLKAYAQKADSLAQTVKCSEVADYLRMWAYTHTYEAYTSLPMAAKINLETLPFKVEDLLDTPAKRLNTPSALLFRSAPRMIYAQLPHKDKLIPCLDYLTQTYTNSRVVKAVTKLAVENYLSHFDYEGHYSEGLAELTAATKKFGLDAGYLEDFKKCRATIKGQPFPAGVKLRDAQGRTVDFSAFRGKYVYIDLWASWCRPCCQEVPYLQQLEAQLENDKVEFVSISIDSSEAAWKKKMEQLKAHGNQLFDADNSLGKALNVKGIPFFVIYDPEGNLYRYNAPRPSQGSALKQLLESLR